MIKTYTRWCPLSSFIACWLIYNLIHTDGSENYIVVYGYERIINYNEVRCTLWKLYIYKFVYLIYAYSSIKRFTEMLSPPLFRALARISELGVQKYTFGVNWVSNSFSSHCIIHLKIWILGCPKSATGCPKDTRTPLWLKACPFYCSVYRLIIDIEPWLLLHVYWDINNLKKEQIKSYMWRKMPEGNENATRYTCNV